MSATEAPREMAEPGTEIYPGDFVLMYVVTNLGQVADDTAGTEGETEERVGRLADEITASPDFSDAETQEKGKAVTTRTPTHFTFDLEWSMRPEPQAPQLSVLGIMDENGQLTGVGPQLECIRLYVYRNDPQQGANPNAVLAEIKEYYGVQCRLDEDGLPNEDHATMDLVGYVNGDDSGVPMQFGKTPTA